MNRPTKMAAVFEENAERERRLKAHPFYPMFFGDSVERKGVGTSSSMSLDASRQSDLSSSLSSEGAKYDADSEPPTKENSTFSEVFDSIRADSSGDGYHPQQDYDECTTFINHEIGHADKSRPCRPAKRNLEPDMSPARPDYGDRAEAQNTTPDSFDSTAEAVQLLFGSSMTLKKRQDLKLCHNPVSFLKELTDFAKYQNPTYEFATGEKLYNCSRSWFAAKVSIVGIEFIGCGKAFAKKDAKQRAAANLVQKLVDNQASIVEEVQVPMFTSFEDMNEIDLQDIVAEDVMEVGRATGSEEHISLNGIGLRIKEKLELGEKERIEKKQLMAKEAAREQKMKTYVPVNSNDYPSSDSVDGNKSICMFESDSDIDPVMNLGKACRRAVGTTPTYEVLHQYTPKNRSPVTEVLSAIKIAEDPSQVVTVRARAANSVVAARLCAEKLTKLFTSECSLSVPSSSAEKKKLEPVCPVPVDENINHVPDPVLQIQNLSVDKNIEAEAAANEIPPKVDIDICSLPEIPAVDNAKKSPNVKTHLRLPTTSRPTWWADIKIETGSSGNTQIGCFINAWKKIKELAEQSLAEVGYEEKE